ncbi:MAG: amidohydrolase family protein [Marmoricola sp.]
MPGLVDAHCHVGLDENGAVDEETAEEQAIADRDGGALLLRDCGSAADTSWIHDREDLPRLIRAGRHIARTKRYIRNYAHEVEPAELPAYVVQEAQRGDGWVKLVGDWIDRDTGDLEPSFPADAFAAAISAAHEHGAKVTAHCFGQKVLPGLIEAGIDCIEHGTGLSEDLIDEMVSRGTALVPTVMQLNNFPDYAGAAGEKFPAYAEQMLDLHARRRDTIMAAHEAGVPIYAGTDAGGVLPHGQIAGEVKELAAYGFTAEAALGAASWRAREWLGLDGRLSEGTTADFVVFDRNPLEDLSVLAEPKHVVLRGQVVR